MAKRARHGACARARILTRIFDGGDYQLKPVGVGAPAIGHVLERHEVGARKYRTHRLFGVPAREIRLRDATIDEMLVDGFFRWREIACRGL